ncbi:MAG: DUF4401 domain-containing protein [Methylococcaceae bacterium]|nr:DUF4401 domain-containing protein [Methylococcaceae bacterium]
MSNYMSQYNAANLIDKLADNDLIEPNRELNAFIINQQQAKEIPLYIRVLIGIGAFIASLCFIAFLAEAKIIRFDKEAGLIVWGLIFVVMAIALQKQAGEDSSIKHSIFIQISFTAMAIGKGLFISGVTQIFDSSWGLSLATLIITGLTYHLYRMSIDRFLSSFVFIFSLLVNILWAEEVSGTRALLFNGFFLFQMLCAAVLLTHGKIKSDYIPLSYAFVFSLCASILFLASHTEFGYWNNDELIHPAFVNIILAGGLIALIGWASGGLQNLKNEALILASLGTVLLGIFSAPGIILAIGLMILGYAKHESLLIILGGLLTPVFLFIFYYNLDISLMYKSGILFVSGLVLLAGRVYLHYKNWDKGALSCVQK